MSYRNGNSFKENKKEIQNFSSIKSLLQEKNLNPKEINDLKYLLSLTINPDLKRFKLFNIDCLLIFLLKYLSPNTLSIFTEFFFQSCELGSLNIVRILLENDLDVNSQNNLGETPLHIAVAKNDIELIKLLIEYNPKTNIATYKDGLTAVNYAEISGNKNVYKIIKELNEKNIKEEIKNEIKDYINIDMDNIIMNSDNNKDNSSSLFFKTDKFNYEQIQNFNGEKISIITDSDINSSLLNNNLNKNNISNYDNKYINTQQTIINESDYNEDITPTNKNIFLYPRNKPKYQNTYQFNINNSSNKKSIKEIKFFSSSFKRKSITNNLSLNPSYIQSLTTCHTSLKYSKIFEFITEINLPKEYANNLIDNGFDNLEMLISQTKNGIALTYENLREIGIKKPGERIKILLHLEEISENFHFIFPKSIYNNNNYDNDNSGIKNKSNTLRIFLEKIDEKKYFKNFWENGIYNVEVLFVQMISKQPLNENILMNDLNIKKQDANKIIIKLYEYSRKYINKLKIINKRKKTEENIISNSSIIYEENNLIKSCDCILF